jgi:ATP-binding cassette subfamily B multidrug efflux pump
MDEATSALDSESEHLIQEAMEELMMNKTVIVIAHRLSTIMKMDKIFVIADGKIIEKGSHNELLLKKGEYAKLWEIQSGGFIGE